MLSSLEIAGGRLTVTKFISSHGLEEIARTASQSNKSLINIQIIYFT